MKNTSRGSLWLTLYAAIVGYTLIVYLTNYPIPELREKILALASAFFLLGGVFFLGRLLLPWVDKSELSLGWKLLYSTALGLGVFGAAGR